MNPRWAILVGLFLAVGLAPGCRRKATAPPTPWLALDTQPPEEGALGILTGPGRGQQAFSVTWVKKRPGDSLPGLEFLAWFRGPKAEKILAVECLSLSQPLVSGEPSEHPAVFAVDGNRALIWGGPSGWGWVDLAKSRARVETLDAHLETLLAGMKEAREHRTSAEGWTLHNRLVLMPAQQAVRTEPRDGAPFAAAGFPAGGLEGEGVWRTSTPKEFSPGSNRPPRALADLDVQRAARPIREVVALPLERRGDWVQVAFPEAGTPTYRVDAVGLGESAENPALLVKWAPPAGWIRLYARGPVEGTQVRRWSWVYYGASD